MIITKKKILTVAAIAVGTVGFLGISYLMKKKNEEPETVNDESDETIVPDIVEPDDETLDVKEESVKEVDEEAVEEKTTTKFPFVDENKLLRYSLINYLAKNGVNEETILCICKVELDILEEIPEEYPKVRSYIKDILGTEYSPELIDKFFNDIYNLLYTTMIPCDIFMRYTNKTIRMGDEYQEALTNLVEAIDTGINNNESEAIDAFAYLYNFLSASPEETFNETTYDTVFKPYVDKFVTVKTEEEKIETPEDVNETEDESIKEDVE